MSFSKWWLHALFPAACIVCQTDIPDDPCPVCAACRCDWRADSLRHVRPNGVDALASAYLFEGPLRDVIHAYKYRGKDYLAGFLTEAWMKRWPSIDSQYDVLVPVPVSWWTFFKRGYNQSALLADRVGKRLNVPVLTGALKRRHTPSQTRLNRKQRFDNAAKSFAINPRLSVRGKRVLLLDDIFTTGATLATCARLLKSAGATYVAAHALAREELKRPT